MTYPFSTSRHGSVLVLRDDRLEGGSKRRALTPLMRRLAEEGAREFVYAGPAEGYAQLALAYSSRELGVKATYFLAKRTKLHRNTVEAMSAGLKIVQVPHGRMNVIQARARFYCQTFKAHFFPLGFATQSYRQELTSQLTEILSGLSFSEIWVAAGSGLLTRCLQAAAPSVPHFAVRVGMAPNVGSAKLFTAPEKFADSALLPPPFPSASSYDAKVWRFVRANASDGALLWNVGR